MKRHLIGIGGVGMSALATAMQWQGDEVTGADRNLETANIRFLQGLGIRVYPDDGSGVDEATDEVVVSTAIEADNAGLKRAAELNIPVTHRAKALARTLGDYKLVAVVGTCGKSTVTAMLGHVLTECGIDPMCVNGANVPGWQGAVRVGKGAYAVAEVDESDKSLVAFTPHAAIVTNASADHYSKEEMDAVFDEFVAKCEGPVIDGRKHSPEGRFPWLREALPMPGAHNLQNAVLAAEMAIALGCKETEIRRAFTTFRGVERRLQRISPIGKLPAVYDDYAHNPEKLKAMWETLAEAYPGGICAIWRPHGYGPLHKLLEPLAQMFGEVIREQDKLVLLPVYDAGGTATRNINSEDLAARLPSDKVALVRDLDEAYEWGVANAGKYAAFVTCGARDPGLPGLARKLDVHLREKYDIIVA